MQICSKWVRKNWNIGVDRGKFSHHCQHSIRLSVQILAAAVGYYHVYISHRVYCRQQRSDCNPEHHSINAIPQDVIGSEKYECFKALDLEQDT